LEKRPAACQRKVVYASLWKLGGQPPATAGRLGLQGGIPCIIVELPALLARITEKAVDKYV